MSFPHRPLQRILSRTGSLALVILFLIVILIAAIGGLFWTGTQAEKRLRTQLAAGTAAFEKDQHDVAITAFTKALGEDGTPLRLFQMVQPRLGQQAQSLDEIRMALVSTYLVKAYDSMMKLKPAPDVLGSAAQFLTPLTGTDSVELKQTLATARTVSELCTQFQKKQYQQVMKDLLAAEKKALPSDQDFFIMEVRLMIACGKVLREPIILEKARELLFFLSYELRIKGPRIDLLWRLLHQ